MRAALTSLVVIACGGSSPRSPQLANTRQAPSFEPLALRAGCKNYGHEDLRIHGEAARVTLVVCLVRENADSEEQRAEGFVMKDYEAELVTQRAGKANHRGVIKNWTDGWEWGSSVSLVGVLVASSGTHDAVVLQASSHDTGSGGTEVLVMSLDAKGWHTEDAQDADNQIDLASDGSVLRIEHCSFGPDVSQEPGLECDATNGLVTRRELRWNGREIASTER